MCATPFKDGETFVPTLSPDEQLSVEAAKVTDPAIVSQRNKGTKIDKWRKKT